MTDTVTQEAKHKPIRSAASLLVVRESDAGLQVLTLKRSQTMRFLPGFLAFPGGTLDPEDWRNTDENWVTGNLMEQGQPDDTAYALGALRECAEEVGWVCAANGREVGKPVVVLKLDEQSALLDNRATFAEVLDRRGVRVNLSDMRFVGRWVTPAYMPARFDTRFFLVRTDSGDQSVRLVSSENEWVRWCEPDALLQGIANGEEQAVPPTIAMLEGLSGCGTVQSCLDSLDVPGPPAE